MYSTYFCRVDDGQRFLTACPTAVRLSVYTICLFLWSSGLGITFFFLSHTVEHLTKLLDTTGLRLAWMPKFTSKLHYLSDEPTFKNEKGLYRGASVSVGVRLNHYNTDSLSPQMPTVASLPRLLAMQDTPLSLSSGRPCVAS